MPRRPRKAAGFTPRPNPGEPFRCAIYTRQSRHKRSPLSSCDVQRDMCVEVVKMRGWLLLEDRFDDPGQSSERLDRPAMQRLMREIEAGRIDQVIVTHIDRLTRKLFDLARLLDFFEMHGVGLIVVADPHYGETAGSRLMTNIVAAASEFQQEMTRERMAKSRAALKRKGRRVAGRVPYGYVADKQTKQLVVQRIEAGHVRRIFELAAAGKRPTEIAEFANTKGWKTRGKGSGRWTARQVLKMLSNPTYVGLIRNGDGTLPGQHNRIVTQDLFDRVQDTITARRSRKPGRSKPATSWPLRGLLKCGRCGRTMSPSVSGHGHIYYRYYRCRSNAGGRPPCRGVCLPAYQIEEFTRSMISGNWDGLPADQAEEVPRFAEQWRSLEGRSQERALPHVIREVVFDPNEGTISVTLVEDAVEKLTAHRDGIRRAEQQ